MSEVEKQLQENLEKWDPTALGKYVRYDCQIIVGTCIGKRKRFQDNRISGQTIVYENQKMRPTVAGKYGDPQKWDNWLQQNKGIGKTAEG